jgi:hypothetical protein
MSVISNDWIPKEKSLEGLKINTYDECTIQPTVLLISLDSEKD